MEPISVPPELSCLTNLERIHIVCIHPVMSFYCYGQQYKYSGNIINFPRDINAITRSFPFRLNDVSAVLVVNRSGTNESQEFWVRRQHVRHVLLLLKSHIYFIPMCKLMKYLSMSYQRTVYLRIFLIFKIIQKSKLQWWFYKTSRIRKKNN